MTVTRGPGVTSRQVLAYWKVAPLDTELRVRRLKQYQTLAADPGHHAQVLAAIFGSSKHDEAVHKERLRDRRLTEHSTPWAVQFAKDIDSLREIEQYDGWAGELEGN